MMLGVLQYETYEGCAPPPTMSYRVTASKARCLLSGFSEPEMLDLGSL